MNVFDFRFFIKEKPCSIHVDSSKDPEVQIVINNKQAVSDSIPVRLLGNSIWYYVMYVNGEKVTVEIDVAEPQHKYNIYLADVSQIDETPFYAELEKAKKTVNSGFKYFVKSDGKRIIKKNAIAMILSPTILLITGAVLKKILAFVIAMVVLAPAYLPFFVLVEWFSMKNLIKNHRKRFRCEKQIKI